MDLFHILSAIIGILVIAVIVVCLCNTQSKGILTVSLASGILFAIALFSVLYPSWWSIAITMCLLFIFTEIGLRYLEDRIKSIFGAKITFSCLALYAIELAICIIMLATNWTWYIALVYIPISIILIILGLISVVAMVAVAVAVATRN